MNYYNRNKVIPMIIDMLAVKGMNISNHNIKIFSTKQMLMVDVKRGCDYIKKLGSDILVYTNYVPNKSYLETNENVRILDNNDLLGFCLEQKNYELYDILNN